jgi:type I restriction enzyme S subunit
MEVKPGYKRTEVGIIPNDWDAVPTSDLGCMPLTKPAH